MRLIAPRSKYINQRLRRVKNDDVKKVTESERSVSLFNPLFGNVVAPWSNVSPAMKMIKVVGNIFSK